MSGDAILYVLPLQGRFVGRIRDPQLTCPPIAILWLTERMARAR